MSRRLVATQRIHGLLSWSVCPDTGPWVLVALNLSLTGQAFHRPCKNARIRSFSTGSFPSMADCTILTITSDEQVPEASSQGAPRSGRRRESDDRGGHASMRRARCCRWPIRGSSWCIGTATAAVPEELNRLLWATTVLARGVPVLVIADRYRVDQATTFYRMGVADYISRTHHVDQFGRILDTYLRHRPASSSPEAASPDDPSQSVKAWSATPRPLKAQVV